MRLMSKLRIGIGILILLVPLGLIIPQYFQSGDAWGEWSITDLKEMVGYIPKGMDKLAAFWKAPFPDYAFNGLPETKLAILSFGYIVSAVIGVFAVVAVVYLLAKFLTKGEK